MRLAAIYQAVERLTISNLLNILDLLHSPSRGQKGGAWFTVLDSMFGILQLWTLNFKFWTNSPWRSISPSYYKRGLVFCFLMGGCATASGPLATLPMASPLASHENLAGIQEYNDGKWEAAKGQFESAIQADPNLPEAHFNLALTLHKLDLHEQATDHFRQAGELAPDNQEIVNSTIYRNHLGLSSTLERHLSGGYRY